MVVNENGRPWDPEYDTMKLRHSMPEEAMTQNYRVVSSDGESLFGRGGAAGPVVVYYAAKWKST